MTNQSNAQSDPRRLLIEARARMAQIRSVVMRELNQNNGVSTASHAEMVYALLDYEDKLQEFKDYPAVEDSDFPNVEPIRDLLAEQRYQTVPSPGLKRGSTTDEIPATVAETSVGQLYDISKEFDTLCQRLGFGPEADIDGVTDDITKDHLESAFFTGTDPDFGGEGDE